MESYRMAEPEGRSTEHSNMYARISIPGRLPSDLALKNLTSSCPQDLSHHNCKLPQKYKRLNGNGKVLFAHLRIE